MKNLKKLPFILAFACTLLAAACSEIDVPPRGEDEDEPIIIVNPDSDTEQSTDSVSLV